MRVDAESFRNLILKSKNERDAIAQVCESLKDIPEIVGISVVYKESKDKTNIVHQCCSPHVQGSSLPEACSYTLEIAKRVMQEQKLVETSFRLPDGRILFAFAHPLLMRDGTCIGCVCFIKCTDRRNENFGKIAEVLSDYLSKNVLRKGILKSSFLASEILSLIDEAVWVTDEEGTVLDCNPAVEAMFGTPSEAIIGKKCPEIVKQHSTFPDTCAIVRRMNREKHSLVKARGNRVYSLSIYRIPTDLFGNLYVHIARDITKHVKFQMHLIQSDRMKTLERVITGLAHEINNPLTAIVGFSNLLLERESDPERKRLIQHINQEALRCATIIKGLNNLIPLNFPDIATVDANQIVKSILELRTFYHKAHNIKVELDLEEDLPLVETSPKAVHQAILNIITNAEDAVLKLGEERIIRVRTWSDPEWIHISIENLGAHIPSSIIDKIFDPFFSTKPKEEGTGIGLSLAKEYIEGIGGKISVENISDGVRFTITIPKGRQTTKELPHESLLCAGESVLVVSSDPVVGNMLQMILERHGAKVVQAHNLHEALRILEKEIFSKVVVNDPLDDASVSEAVQMVVETKRHLKGKTLVLLSGVGDQKEYMVLKDLKCKVLFKPFDERELLERVTNAES